jgi:hypothetical protein
MRKLLKLLIKEVMKDRLYEPYTLEFLELYGKSAKFKREKFKNIVDFAEDVINKVEREGLTYDEHPVYDVIRLVGRNIQTNYMNRVIFRKNISLNLDGDCGTDNMFNINNYVKLSNNDSKKLRDIIKESKSNKVAKLGKDLVLPSTWRRDRLLNTICDIGEGRFGSKRFDSPGGTFEQTRNHNIELWLPLGIYWVHNGNHSPTVGIIQSEGVIVPLDVYDISELYEYIYSDGNKFYNKFDGSEFDDVNCVEFAAIFEIGRLIKEKNITF